jgi:hypothetical protein
MHIEPLGATAQQQGRPTPPAAAGAKPDPDYNIQQTFERGVTDVDTVAKIVEKHGGRMTIQAQSPFTTSAVKYGSTILSDLEDRGHEIGLHFHEPDHMGKDSSALSSDRWCTVFKEEMVYPLAASFEVSTGRWQPLRAADAKRAPPPINSDWKNRPQTTDALIARCRAHPADEHRPVRIRDTTQTGHRAAKRLRQGDFASMRRSKTAAAKPPTGGVAAGRSNSTAGR